MLIVSLALHVGLLAGVALSRIHARQPVMAASAEAKVTSLILLRSFAAPDLSHPALPATKPVAQPVVTNTQAVSTSPVKPVAVPQKPAAATPPPSFALEANPNAHVRALPPEAVLSPSPAPPLDGSKGVVFILDVSGSMYEPYAGSSRLAFARETLGRQIRALKEGTPFAITVYAETAQNSGPLVPANEATRDAAVRFIQRDIDCGGGTNLPAGFALAGGLHTGALVLVTDGDLNISESDLMNKAADILGENGRCPALTVIAIGPRPDTKAKLLLQELAEQQGGTYRAESCESNGNLVTTVKPEAATP